MSLRDSLTRPKNKLRAPQESTRGILASVVIYYWEFMHSDGVWEIPEFAGIKSLHQVKGDCIPAQ